MELPVLCQPPPSTLSTHQQQVPQPVPTLSSILTLLDISFFPMEDSWNYHNHRESSWRYRVLLLSRPLLLRKIPPSSNSSTIPDISLLPSIDTPNETNTTPITAHDFTLRCFIHFHGSTAGIGLAKRWSCQYCIFSSFLYSLIISFYFSWQMDNNSQDKVKNTMH